MDNILGDYRTCRCGEMTDSYDEFICYECQIELDKKTLSYQGNQLSKSIRRLQYELCKSLINIFKKG